MSAGGAQPDRGSGEHRTEALTLASRSPQRRALLEQLGVEFTVAVPDVDERTAGDPRSLVVQNALAKARAVPGEVVLGVDTAVVVDGDVLGKPPRETDARAFITRLAGRAHDVWSGIALIERGVERTAASRTTVRFRPLREAEIAWYLSTGEWRERAGGYAIQGRGAALVEAVDGDYTAVVGLPVSALVELAPGLLHG